MKEPKSFKDICELQKELDSHIVNVRERTGRDIIKSMIAEIIRSLYSVFSALVDLTLEYGYTKEDILKTYWKKWQKNMERIGREWN